jgi:hypothetical protein
MKLATAGCVVLLFSTLVSTSAGSECVAMPPPLKLCGKLHGKTIDPSGAVIPHVELRVVSLKGVVAAEFRSDSEGRFVFDFSSVVRGTYDLNTTTKGWESFVARVIVGGPNFRLWRRPLVVKLGIGSECTSGVSRDRLI